MHNPRYSKKANKDQHPRETMTYEDHLKKKVETGKLTKQEYKEAMHHTRMISIYDL